ncbi:hypothetical protein Taro_029320 [Colocasia esculenta]|uniref:Ureidoglycolate hydrolase n=1 Tax=Colocasia esculenta TaxID=4460 RepID=A0A843VJI9_COLES|nr:hypothetical protein [Colocasia esculenta]
MASEALSRATLFLSLLFLLCAIFFTSGHEEDSTRRTMEQFSGYPVEPPASHLVSSQSSSLSVDAEGLQRQIDELSAFSDTPAPSVTRILYSEKDVLARRYIKDIMGHLGLSIREDAIGNIFARWEGYEAELSAVATGSHIDAIPYSGKYDGVVGVLGALEAINALKRHVNLMDIICACIEESLKLKCHVIYSSTLHVSVCVWGFNSLSNHLSEVSGFLPKRSLEVILFTSEEPTRFGISCLGSRLLAGSKPLAESLKVTVDGQNTSFFDAAAFAGYAKNGGDISSVFMKKGHYFAFLELHIEQGPILEKEGIPIGVVTAIAAPASIKVRFEGSGGHAGAVLMPTRNDAGLAAAELSLAVEKHVLDSGSVDTVGTVGILELHPGAINSIPSKSNLEIDTRDIDESRRNEVIEKIHQSAVKIAEKRGVKLSEFKIVNQDPPARSDDMIINATVTTSQQLNLSHKLMISRAYHDSLFMARSSCCTNTCLNLNAHHLPAAAGYSHKPEEYASPMDIANGVKGSLLHGFLSRDGTGAATRRGGRRGAPVKEEGEDLIRPPVRVLPPLGLWDLLLLEVVYALSVGHALERSGLAREVRRQPFPPAGCTVEKIMTKRKKDDSAIIL